MTDLSISHSQSATGAGKIATVLTGLIALFQTACSAPGRATTEHAHRRAARRAPEEILIAHARREEARRGVERLLLLR